MGLSDKKSNLVIIGATEFVEIAGIKNIPAKIDTGADSSAIHASSIDMEPDGTLVFALFDEEFRTKDYAARVIRSSNGIEQIRYRVTLPVAIAGQTFETAFTLADRSRNKFPVLIGRRAIKDRFLVDVSKSIRPPAKYVNSVRLSDELSKNPLRFHQKYIIRKEKK